MLLLDIGLVVATTWCVWIEDNNRRELKSSTYIDKITLVLIEDIVLSLISLYGYISEKEDLGSFKVIMAQL